MLPCRIKKCELIIKTDARPVKDVRSASACRRKAYTFWGKAWISANPSKAADWDSHSTTAGLFDAQRRSKDLS